MRTMRPFARTVSCVYRSEQNKIAAWIFCCCCLFLFLFVCLFYVCFVCVGGRGGCFLMSMSLLEHDYRNKTDSLHYISFIKEYTWVCLSGNFCMEMFCYEELGITVYLNFIYVYRLLFYSIWDSQARCAMLDVSYDRDILIYSDLNYARKSVYNAIII